jgi:flagellar biosynthesis/type III secretory pathway chaperone
MAMNNINYLADVMTAEAELTEQLVEAMRQQQAALVKTDSATIETITERQEELLLPIEGFERERLRLTREVWSEIAGEKTDDADVIHVSSLILLLQNEEAATIANVAKRLHTAVEQLVTLKQANDYLIEHSRKFVRETFKIVSNGYARQLVDQKI